MKGYSGNSGACPPSLGASEKPLLPASERRGEPQSQRLSKESQQPISLRHKHSPHPNSSFHPSGPPDPHLDPRRGAGAFAFARVRGSAQGKGRKQKPWQMWRSGMGKEAGRGTPAAVVAVAVDSDKSSQHALKWAADHVLSRNQIFFLLHVRRKITSIPTPSGHQLAISEVGEDVASAFIEDLDFRTKEMLLPFQCFCSKRGLQCKEIVLDDTDVAGAIINFVVNQKVDKLVMGVSSRNALTRTFKAADVPTSVSKVAPDFCAVYVISKGKISSVRPATNPNSYPLIRQANEAITAGAQFLSMKSEPDIRHQNGSPQRSNLHRGAKMGFDNDNKSSERVSKFSHAGSPYDFSYPSISSCPSPSRPSMDRPQNYFREYADAAERSAHMRYMWNENDRQMRGSEFSRDGGSYPSSNSGISIYSPNRSYEDQLSSWSGQSVEEMDHEIRRLKLELQQTKEMYEGGPPKESSSPILRVKLAGEGTNETAEKKRFRPQLLHDSPRTPQNKTESETSRKTMDADTDLLEGAAEKRTAMEDLATGIRYRKYTIDEIKKATNDFSDALKIGEGGYGPVYKSTLDHTLVAIKVLRCDVAQGMKQFQQEVEVLSCIRHPNMVLLMGACPESGCLVYEFMANGSLEDRLLCQSNTPPLSWQLRFKIAAEIATGLLFLHQTKPEPLVHRDLKPANVLLDHNYVSKIADVGLARLVPPAQAGSNSTQYCMTAAAGTFCYIDPEYQKTGMLGIKSDIYALGIILLQLLTGSQPMGLAHNAERAVESGKIEDILDPKVPDWPVEEAVKFAKLALRCSELRRRDRPDLATIVLPELNRLRVMADSMMEGPWTHRLDNSRSYKESQVKQQTSLSEMFDAGPAIGTSFA